MKKKIFIVCIGEEDSSLKETLIMLEFPALI
jgi:hypothetical protein